MFKVTFRNMKDLKDRDETIRRFAEIRAEEVSNGEKRLEELSELDQEMIWSAAEDDAIAWAEHEYDRRMERTQ